MNQPLVSVICICHNHAAFVTEALDSVMTQTYPHIDLIIIDDASTDGSAKIIKRWLAKYPQATLVLNSENLGYCKTFNRAFALTQGEFIIDLAADDILLPDRIATGVQALEQAGPEYGVTFSDALHMDAAGAILWKHSDQYPHESIPSGDIYRHLINRYFICSPTMMFKREVLISMEGYDESLTYEDFDLWIRSARNFKYVYTPQVLVKKRKLKNSMSHAQRTVLSKHGWSTLEVCRKIKLLNRTDDERRALNQRIGYEIRQSLRAINLALTFRYLILWWQNRS